MNVLFIGFHQIRDKTIVYGLLIQDQFCVWLIVSFDRRMQYFLWAVLNETALSLFFLLDFSSRTCSIPWEFFFVLFPNIFFT